MGPASERLRTAITAAELLAAVNGGSPRIVLRGKKVDRATACTGRSTGHRTGRRLDSGRDESAAPGGLPAVAVNAERD